MQNINVVNDMRNLKIKHGDLERDMQGFSLPAKSGAVLHLVRGDVILRIDNFQ